MPDWAETAPPVFEQLSPVAKTYVPGSAADDNSPLVDYITMQNSPTAEVASARVVPTTDIRSRARATSTRGCEETDYPTATAGRSR